MKLNGKEPIIITIIYSDGITDIIKRDNRIFHMEYLKSLIDTSSRLKEITMKKGINLPTDLDELRCTLSFNVNKELAEEGIVVINNLCIDIDFMDEDNVQEAYNIYLPSELSDKQKELLQNILDNNEMDDSSFGQYHNGEMIDILYDEVKDMIMNKTK